MGYSIDRLVSGLNDSDSVSDTVRRMRTEKPDFDRPVGLYPLKRAIDRMRERVCAPDSFDPDTAGGFIDMLGVSGISVARQHFYVCRLALVMKAVRGAGVARTADLDIDGCRRVLATFVENPRLGGETRAAYAVCIKRLVNYSKTGRLGSKSRSTGEDTYVPEVSWIVPSGYRRGCGTVRRQDLLTAEEFLGMVRAAKNPRDRALLWVMFEGAFRPGELLEMRVGGAEFADRYMMMSTEGKTGPKSVALVLASRPVAEWLNQHPHAGDPRAPLWYSPMSPGLRLGYAALTKIVQRAARDAGIRRRVWNYLLRHTQLTHMSKRLPDRMLRLYGNWTPTSKMSARYTHLTDEDAKNAVLEIHGIGGDGKADDILRMTACPRCEYDCTPDLDLCPRCGLMLSESERARITTTDIVKSRMRDKLLRARALEQELDTCLGRLVGSGASAGVRPVAGPAPGDPGPWAGVPAGPAPAGRAAEPLPQAGAASWHSAAEIPADEMPGPAPRRTPGRRAAAGRASKRRTSKRQAAGDGMPGDVNPGPRKGAARGDHVYGG